MLETVRIRRAGYNVRITYEEFKQLYRVLLPKGLLSSKIDTKEFFLALDLNKQHYQFGSTKIYMRESQKMRLDLKLHTKIIESIKIIQRWYRQFFYNRNIIIKKESANKIQLFYKAYLKRKNKLVAKLLNDAAIVLQSFWKMYTVRKWYKKLLVGIIVIQSLIRGKQARRRAQKVSFIKN